MNTQNIMIKAQNGSRIPYDKILSISPTRCGSGSNDFAIVAIFNTENKAYPKDVLFTGTEAECNDWFKWLDKQLEQTFQENAISILEYPEITVWKNGYQTTERYLEELNEKYWSLIKEHDERKKKANKNTTIFNRVKVPKSEELIATEIEHRKYFWGMIG